MNTFFITIPSGASSGRATSGVPIIMIIIIPVVVMRVIIVIRTIPIIGTPGIVIIVIIERIPIISTPNQAIATIVRHLIVFCGFIIIIDNNLTSRIRYVLVDLVIHCLRWI